VNVLPSSLAPAAAPATLPTARGDAAGGSEPGAFAEVLGQRLQRPTQHEEHEAAPAGRTARTGTRKPHEAAGAETQQADALPLIAAAIESRSLAQPGTDAAAASAASAASPLAAHGMQNDARGARRAAETGTVPQPAPATDVQADGAPMLHRHAGDDAARLVPAATRSGERAQGEAEGAKRPALPSAPAAVSTVTAPAAAAPRATSQHTASSGDAASSGANRASTRSEDNGGVQGPRHDAAPSREPVRASGPDEPSARSEPAAMPVVAGTNAVAPAGAPAAPAAAPGYVAPAVASQAWGPALGQEVARLHHAGHGQAQLELNPPGLGPLSVSLSVADQQAHAVFVSPHPAVRAAVEAALPQLRNALADNGISLGQASVGAEHQPPSGSFAQPGQDRAPQRRWTQAVSAAPERSATLPVAPRRAGGNVLDTFA
jgi:flagellar hook-length control protein FliK